jgi:hypothetical protein
MPPDAPPPRRAAGSAGRVTRPVDLPATGEAVIQIWAARTSGLRGALAVHCWLVLKRAGDVSWERWDVVGRRARTGRIGLQRNARSPREGWGAGRPHLLLERRGPDAEAALPMVEALIAGYPQDRRYRSWPGPNCNSFVAHLVRSVPALATTLPPLAIGKDYLPDGRLVAPVPSRTGWQLSIAGLAGLLVAAEEGVEINLLGMVLGWRPRPPCLLLPGLGALRLAWGRGGINRPFSPTG